MPSVDVETSFVGWVALRAVTLDVRAVVPILRIVDVERARDFYVGYLGFTVDWRISSTTSIRASTPARAMSRAEPA